jgi:uncharacterized membrane protein
MRIFADNTSWMLFNIFLAIVPVVLGWLLLRIKNGLLKTLIGIVWFLFLPNTIYIFTDLAHIIPNWGMVNNWGRFILLIQYGVLEVIGFITFILALYPFEKIIHKNPVLNKKNRGDLLIILINYLIGFGIVLGRIERINSWDALFNIKSVFQASLHILSSPELLFLVIFFGLLSNFYYFLFRKIIIKLFSFDK